MKNHYETKHIFLAVAIFILLLSPVLLFIVPPFVGNTLYHTTDLWYVLVPGRGYIIYGVGFLFLVLSSAIIFILDINLKSIIFSVIFILLGGFSFYSASFMYTSLSNSSISYGTLIPKEQHTYLWDEVDKAIYYEVPSEEGFSKYEFFLKDGTSIELPENGVVQGFRDGIRFKVNVENVWVE